MNPIFDAIYLYIPICDLVHIILNYIPGRKRKHNWTTIATNGNSERIWKQHLWKKRRILEAMEGACKKDYNQMYMYLINVFTRFPNYKFDIKNLLYPIGGYVAGG